MTGQAKFRLLLSAALLALLAYLGFLVVQERDPHKPYEMATKEYDEAAGTLEPNGQHEAAAAAYDRARVLLEHAYKQLDSARGLDPEAVKALGGKILYLKAKAIRDKHYALAAASGKPLAEADDSVTGATFRNVLAIPDPAERENAVGSLRGAALHFLASDVNVQLDALRLALMVQPLAWDQIEKHCKAILQAKPDDSRANFWLAKIDFEQPDQRTGLPTPLAKRSGDRVRSALDAIETVRADPKFPVWRAEHLRAAAHLWLVKHSRKPGKSAEHLAILERDLFARDSGVLARIRRGDALDRPNVWDGESVAGLYAIAAEVAIESIRRTSLALADTGKRPDSSPLTYAFAETLAFRDAKTKKSDPAFPRHLLLATVLSVMVDGQAILSIQTPDDWRRGLDFVRPMLDAEFKDDRCDSFRVAQFAELLMRQARIESLRNPNSPSPKALRDEAKDWIARGFAFARKRHHDLERMLPLHLLAANIGYLNGEPRESLAPHLAALNATGKPQTLATARFIDGAIDEREGRLGSAKDKIESALRIGGGDEEVRGNAALAGIYLALGRPDYALINLTRLQNILSRYEELSLQEKEWLAVFFGGPQNVYALAVVAHAENARRAISGHFDKNPGATAFPPDLVKADEDRIRELLNTELVTAAAAPGFAARAAWIHHLTLTNRLAQAEELWRALNAAAPGRVELLLLKVGLMERQAKDSADPKRKASFQADIDQLFRDFMAAHPNESSAKLQYAIWLAHTRRGDEAAVYVGKLLESASLNPETRRVAAAILLSTDAGAAPAAILRHLPRDPRFDRVLADLGRNLAGDRDNARGSLLRHESLGSARVLLASELRMSGDFAKAAEAFVGCFDFTRLKPFAEEGYLRSVFGLAGADLPAAAKLVEQVRAERPDEPVAWLAYAYVLLLQGEIGTPADEWQTRRTMGAALNAWEQKLSHAGELIVPIALTRGEFWFRAQRADLAVAQMQRALHLDRDNVTVLAALVGVMFDDPSQANRRELREYLEELRRNAPHAPATRRLLGRWYERSGQWDDAASVYESLVERFPADRDSYARLVESLFKDGRPADALKWTKTWRERMPNDSQAVAAEIRLLCLGKSVPRAVALADEFLARAESVAKAAAASIADDKVRARAAADARWLTQIELARGFFRGGALDEAERRFAQLPEPYSRHPGAREWLAELYLKQKRWAEAEAILRPLVESSPRNFRALNNLAQLYLEMKSPAKAREAILTALKPTAASVGIKATDRFPVEFLQTVGATYSALGDPALAPEMLRFFAAAAPRFPNDPRVDLYSAAAYVMLGDHGQARDHYALALKKASDPSLSDDQRTAIVTEASAGRDRAEAALRKSQP